MEESEIKIDFRLRGNFEMCSSCLAVVKDCFEPDDDNEIEEELLGMSEDELYAMPTEDDLRLID